MVCARCGAPRHPEKERCEYCGGYFPRSAVEPPAPPERPERPLVVNVYQSGYQGQPAATPQALPISPKNRWVAALLCWFFGYLGVHRFYVGKIGTGILYLLTVGFFGIGVFIDFWTIVFGAFRDKDGFKLKQ